LTPARMRDINGKSVALLGRRPPHFSTGVYKRIENPNLPIRAIHLAPVLKERLSVKDIN